MGKVIEYNKLFKRLANSNIKRTPRITSILMKLYGWCYYDDKRNKKDEG